MNNLQTNLGLCVKNLKQEVLSQNETCEKFCGIMIGQLCNDGCMANYASLSIPDDKLNEGMLLIKNSVINDNIVDAVIINDRSTITTIIYSLEEKMKNIDLSQEELKNFGLTKSEVTIFTMVMQGQKNAQICKNLFISKATLKTHLNNIYKKLPASWHFYKKRI